MMINSTEILHTYIMNICQVSVRFDHFLEVMNLKNRKSITLKNSTGLFDLGTESNLPLFNAQCMHPLYTEKIILRIKMVSDFKRNFKIIFIVNVQEFNSPALSQ